MKAPFRIGLSRSLIVEKSKSSILFAGKSFRPDLQTYLDWEFREAFENVGIINDTLVKDCVGARDGGAVGEATVGQGHCSCEDHISGRDFERHTGIVQPLNVSVP